MKQYRNNPRRVTKKRLDDLAGSLWRFGDLGGIVHNLETDEIIGGGQRMTVFADSEVVVIEQYDQPDEQGTVGLGFVVWQGKKFAYRQVRWDQETASEANIRANLNAGEWNWDILQGMGAASLDALGFDVERLNGWREGMGTISLLLSGIGQDGYTSLDVPAGEFPTGEYTPSSGEGVVPADVPDFFDATKVSGAVAGGDRKKTYLIYVAFSDEERFYAMLEALTFGDRKDRRDGTLFAAISGDQYTERWESALGGVRNATG